MSLQQQENFVRNQTSFFSNGANKNLHYIKYGLVIPLKIFLFINYGVLWFFDAGYFCLAVWLARVTLFL